MRIQDISFELGEREIFAILGRTGAGKTLLLESAADSMHRKAATFCSTERPCRAFLSPNAA